MRYVIIINGDFNICLKFTSNSFTAFIYDDVTSTHVDILIADCTASGETRTCIA